MYSVTIRPVLDISFHFKYIYLAPVLQEMAETSYSPLYNYDQSFQSPY